MLPSSVLCFWSLLRRHAGTLLPTLQLAQLASNHTGRSLRQRAAVARMCAAGLTRFCALIRPALVLNLVPELLQHIRPWCQPISPNEGGAETEGTGPAALKQQVSCSGLNRSTLSSGTHAYSISACFTYMYIRANKKVLIYSLVSVNHRLHVSFINLSWCV